MTGTGDEGGCRERPSGWPPALRRRPAKFAHLPASSSCIGPAVGAVAVGAGHLHPTTPVRPHIPHTLYMIIINLHNGSTITSQYQNQ
jgi:hypothetical protein